MKNGWSEMKVSGRDGEFFPARSAAICRGSLRPAGKLAVRPEQGQEFSREM